MTTIAILGPVGSDCYQAAHLYSPDAELICYNSRQELLSVIKENRCDLALIPVYNTREGEIKDYFRTLVHLEGYSWIDNIVLPIHLSMGSINDAAEKDIEIIVARDSVFNQCKDYLNENFPNATLMNVQDIETSVSVISNSSPQNYAVIESEQLLKKYGFTLLDREIASHNKTRFAVLSSEPAEVTGYDATAIITRPLKDRVGILFDILGEFTRRGINILDLRSENDIETQKLQIYIEAEGHIKDPLLQEALQKIERAIIQEKNSLKLLGSFPRIDMRVKKIKSFGFIGTGAMSEWFANKLESEGYSTLITGRTTQLTPEQMIDRVDVVIICVPISITATVIQQYGPLLQEGQALILLAGESEHNLKVATQNTLEGVEVMLVHNLWGPQTVSMKDKNAAVVRTRRSGTFCDEFEAFLYKHGAEIYQDSATLHDLLMGVGQKLPTIISVALASTLSQHNISCNDICSHSTLTSIYGVLAMARIHNQNPRTYAEIMSSRGDGRKLLKHLLRIY